MKKLRLRNVVCPMKARSKLQSQDSNPGYLTLKTVFLRSHYMALCQDVYQAHTVVLLVSPWCPQELYLTKKVKTHKPWGVLHELCQGHVPLGLYHSIPGKAEEVASFPGVQ